MYWASSCAPGSRLRNTVPFYAIRLVGSTLEVLALRARSACPRPLPAQDRVRPSGRIMLAARRSRAGAAAPGVRRCRIAVDVGRAAPVLATRVRGLGEPPPARDRRVSPGGE